MSFQHKVDNWKEDKYANKPTQFRGQVSDMIPEFSTALPLLVPN